MMLYAVVAALNLVACCYLLFRRGNCREQFLAEIFGETNFYVYLCN